MLGAGDKGISEAVIWGKGELEDQLYQPKNDNLLFAYFGISLTIRRRSQATQIRSEIATKRKLKKTILLSSADVLLRDPSTEEYPRVKEGERPTKWGVYAPEALSHNGLELIFRGFLHSSTPTQASGMRLTQCLPCVVIIIGALKMSVWIN